VDNVEEGTAPAAATPDTGTAPGSGEPSGYDKGDYLARVEHEPEFAVSQVKEKDRKITELQENTRRFDGLDEYLTVLGGADGLKRYVENTYSIINSQPQLAAALTESLQTGQVPTIPALEPAGQETDDDVYVDPDIKALRQQVSDLTAKLDSQSQVLDRRFAQAETRSFKGGIDENVKSIMDKFAVNDEIREEMTKTITDRVREAETKAKSGDSSSLQLLNSLSGPEGAKTLRMLVVDITDRHAGAIEAARQNSAAETVQSRATGDPGTGRSAGGGAPGSVSTKTADWVQQALEKNAKSIGRDANKVFNPLT